MTDILGQIMNLGRVMDEDNFPELGRELHIPADQIKLLNEEFKSNGGPPFFQEDLFAGTRIGMVDRFRIIVAREGFPMYTRMRNDGGQRLEDYEKNGLQSKAA